MRNHSGRFVGALTVGLVALGLVALTPTAANAHTGTIGSQVGCYSPATPGEASIVWKVYNDHPQVMTVVASTVPGIAVGVSVPERGAWVSTGNSKAPGVYSGSVTFQWADGFTQTAAASVTVGATDLVGNCALPPTTITPVSPVFTPATCDAPFSLTGLEQAGMTYTVAERKLSSGPVVDVTYAAVAPLVLKGAPAFRFKNPAPVDCVTPTPEPEPTTEPTVAPEPETTTEPAPVPPVATPTEPAAPDTPTTHAELAETGTDAMSPWLVGIALALMGGGILALFRKRATS